MHTHILNQKSLQIIPADRAPSHPTPLSSRQSSERFQRFPSSNSSNTYFFVLKHLLSLLRALLKSAIYLARTNFTGASSQAGIACCTETMTSRRFRFGSNNLCFVRGPNKIEKDCLENRHGQQQHSTESKLMTLLSSIGMAGSKTFGQLHVDAW